MKNLFYLHLEKKLIFILLNALVFMFSDILYKVFFLGYLKKKEKNENFLCTWFDFTYQIGIFSAILGTFLYKKESDVINKDLKNDKNIKNKNFAYDNFLKESYTNFLNKNNKYSKRKKFFIFIFILVLIFTKFSEEYIKNFTNPSNFKIFCYDGSFFSDLFFLFMFIESYFLHKYFSLENYVFYNFKYLALSIIGICCLIKMFVVIILSKNNFLDDFNDIGYYSFALIINFLHSLLFNLIYIYIRVFLMDGHKLFALNGLIGIVYYIYYILTEYKNDLSDLFSNPFIYLMLLNSIYQTFNVILQTFILTNFQILYFGFVFILFKLFNSIQEVQNFFEGKDLSTTKYSILIFIYIFSYVLGLIAFLIFSEILQLNFFGLNKNTKNNIIEREIDEFNDSIGSNIN